MHLYITQSIHNAIRREMKKVQVGRPQIFLRAFYISTSAFRYAYITEF